MQRSFPYRPLGVAVLMVLLTVAAIHFPAERARPADPKAPDAAAVERTRDTVKLLDDVHKGYVINITKSYVRAREATPAATVVKRVFAHLEKTGHGTGRLIDATGKPIVEGNVAKSDFEKRAVAAIKSGKPYFDEVGEKDGKPVLRAATVVPAVLPACITCHPHVKEGEVLGALIYELPIR